ncbi:MAG: hypothetical protein JFAIHJKO_02780 [Pyrinomonadaceae bacterium]|nr:hypothetical protein [Pyrinomonadaceae bacterium]
MAVTPTSIKFTSDQRAWLKAEANRKHSGKIGTLIKDMVDRKRKSSNRAKPKAN